MGIDLRLNCIEMKGSKVLVALGRSCIIYEIIKGKRSTYTLVIKIVIETSRRNLWKCLLSKKKQNLDEMEQEQDKILNKLYNSKRKCSQSVYMNSA